MCWFHSICTLNLDPTFIIKQAVYLRIAKESPENMRPRDRCSVLVEDVSLHAEAVMETNEHQVRKSTRTCHVSGLRITWPPPLRGEGKMISASWRSEKNQRCISSWTRLWWKSIFIFPQRFLCLETSAPQSSHVRYFPCSSLRKLIWSGIIM